MAGTILAEISLEGGKRFTKAVTGATDAIDEMGDEAEESDRQVGRLSRSFSALSVGTEGVSARVGTFGRGLKSIIPILGTLAVVAGGLTLAIAPLAIGMAAIGAAIGLIVGSGIIAWGEGFQKAMKKAQKEIMPMIKTFGKQFIPFLKETIGLLPDLVKNLLNAVGPMDPFVNALRQVRDVAFEVLPKMIGWFFDLGRQVLPVVLNLSKVLLKNLFPAIKGIVNVGQDIAGFIGRMVSRFRSASSEGTTLRKKFDQLVTAGKRFWKNLQPVINALKPLARQLIRLAPVIAQVALDVGRFALNLGSKLLPYLIPLINMVTRIAKWFNSLSYGIKRAVLIFGGLLAIIGPIISIGTTLLGLITSIVSILTTIYGVIGTVITALSFLFSAFTTIVSAVTTVIAIFNPFSLTILAIIAVIGTLAYIIYTNWNKIVSWTKNLVSSVTGWLNDLVSTAKSLGSAIANGLVDMFNAALPDQLGLPEFTIPRVGFEIPGLTIAGHTIYEGQSVGVGPFGPFGGQSVSIPQLQTGGMIESEGLAMLHEGEQVVPAAQVDRQQQPGSSQINVDVNLSTDDEALQKWVDDRADVKVKENVKDTLRRAKRRGRYQ